MLNKKPDVLAALESIEGIKGGVFAARPKKLSKMPCISFYEINNSPAVFADDTEYLTEVNFVIDVWANTDEELERITAEVNRAMTGINFTREFSRDMQEASDIRRKTTRYMYMGG